MQVAAMHPTQDLQQQSLDDIRGRGSAGGCFQYSIQVATEVTVEGLKDQVEAIPLAVDIKQLDDDGMMIVGLCG